MKKFKLAVLSVLIFSTAFCSRFKVEKLESDLLFTIPIGNSAGELSFPKQHGIYYGIPSRVGISGDWIIVSEQSKKRIKIFKDKNISVIITRENEQTEEAPPILSAKGKSVDTVKSPHLEIPGIVVAGADDDFYVVSYSPTSQDSSEVNSSQGESGAGFYKIIHYDVKGNFLNLIGREGKVELPFETILWMDIDSENRLWVLHRHLGELYLDQYVEGVNTISFTQKDCEDSLYPPSEMNEKDNTISVCEFMYPNESGEEVLMVGKTEKVSDKKSDKTDYAFLYRRFVLYNKKTSQKNIVFEKLNDPEDYPYIPYGDNIFIWRTLNPSKIRLGIYTNEGDITKSYQIELFGKRPGWRSLYGTLSRQIVGLRIFKNNLEIYEWR